MWNRDRSTLLSLVCTRIVMLLGLVLAALFITLPFINDFLVSFRIEVDPAFIWLAPIYYAFCIPAYVALVSLDRLLVAIKKGEVFTDRNIKLLRIITWCCFAVVLVLLLGILITGRFYIFLAVPTVLAVFFGLVLRVVKNLFAAAVALKNDNDYTI